ncbi:hypothetical protein E6P78_13465 [Streptomyces sp. A0958]|uniref:hypothetical protein n=1 Tax=Streptomyces sp. A0958 TaxID=2563101 RepID=UPI00109E8AB5|nr:hypothetical protein [Streptomyces sp. A0958]THA68664.1 hypothetical protein E6P78_13465 [Streptomyces sp. A0958]
MKNADSASRSVQKVYAERLAADLAANRSEQEDLTAQIAELRARLERRRKDESWLTGVQTTLSGTTVPSRPRPAPQAGAAPVSEVVPAVKAVPKPRRAKRAKVPAVPAGGTGKKAAATAGAPLHQLIRALMPVGEPRLAREVHVELEEAHPDRRTSVQVVRNTLETMVKRGVVTKGIQKGAAMYTASEPATTAETAGQPVREKAPAAG